MAHTLVSSRKIARRIALGMGLLLILVAVVTLKPAYADNTFLLQLETSDSQALAKEKWQEVKTKNSDVLGNLTMHIAEVALPPDNKLSYRTQVGPLASRADAETLCNTLQGRGVDCYVVETAMFASEAAPESIAEISPPPSAAETKAAPSPANLTPSAQGAPSAQAAAPAPVPTAPVPAAPVPAAPVPAASTPAPAPAPAPQEADEEKTPAPHKAAPAPAPEEASHADDPDYIPPPVDSGPVIISSSQVMTPSSTAASPRAMAPAEIAEAAPPKAAAPASVPAAPSAPAAVATTASSGLAHYEPGREPHDLNAGETAPAPAPVVTAAAAPQAAPSADSNSAQQGKPGFFSRLFGATSPKAAPTESVVGSVNVAEAVRVPLSTNTPPRTRVIPVMPQVHPVAGTPSESSARAYWAQISYFRDEAQALTFYRQFSASYPQFTDGVRIRITRPFTSTLVADRVSLRVGPFAGTGDVQAICYTADRWKARCTVVRDIGASNALGVAPSRPAMPAAPAPGQPESAYLAQIGTYPNEEEAWDAWKVIQKQHRSLLRHMKATVTQPPASSAPSDLFRLRAGPFKSNDQANAVCSKLSAAGIDCIVVTDR